MKFFGINISFTKVKNVSKELTTQANTFNHIDKFQAQIYRITEDIGKWRRALLYAENIYNPQRFNLYQTYNDIMLDSHLSACISQRKNLTLSRRFIVVDKEGKENKELTKIIKAKWFDKFVDYSLDSIYWGYSLIQFDSLINDVFKSIEVVPRQFVKPEFEIVAKNWGDITGIKYTDKPYSDFCIGVGEKKDLGLLNKAAPLCIWKKNAIGAWSQHQEIFGSPIRIGKTNSRDKATTDKMDNMLKNMGVAAWGRFSHDDIIELIETNNGDAHMVFDALIERCNSEISKLILGQTGTTVEKSFVGSAEVHERILKMYAESDEKFICKVLNDQLIPMLEGLGINFKGHRIESEEDDELSIVERSKIDLELLKYYSIPPDYIQKTYGTPVIPKIEVDTTFDIKRVTNSIKDLYN